MLESIPRVPRIPRHILERHDAFVATDTPFAAVARLLQSLWRQEHGYAVGTFKGRRLGSYLTDEDGKAGVNFITPEVAALVRRELLHLDRGTRVDHKRLARNLLTSQALCFNLFGALKLAPATAQAFFRQLAPDIADQAVDLRFEHAPGRSTPNSTSDHTAFDAFPECRNADGQRTFLAFEVKYVEHMRDDATTPRLQLDTLAAAATIFHDPTDPALRVAPLQQLWREHLLTLSLIGPDRPYADGRFIFIAPRHNAECWNAVDAYTRHLTTSDPAITRFQAVTTEHCLDLLHEAGATQEAAYLRTRYINLERLIDAVTEFHPWP